MRLFAEGWDRVTTYRRVANYAILDSEDEHVFPYNDCYLSTSAGHHYWTGQTKDTSNTVKTGEVRLKFRYFAEPGMNGNYKMEVRLSKQEVAKLFAAAFSAMNLSEVVSALAEARKEEGKERV